MNPLVLFIMILGCTISAATASAKNRSVGGWAVAGALFPLIAIIWVACLPRRLDDPEQGIV